MSITCASTPTSAAQRAAERNLAANLGAIRVTQLRLADELGNVAVAEGEPVFGRDGALTMLDDAGRWWAGCSLPRRASRAVLTGLDVRGTVACFLVPPHAAYVRTALDMTGPQQAVLALTPDLHELAVLLRCEDFSADIEAHRLWFAWGESWAAQIERLFAEQPGLPTPGQFIRLPFLPAEVAEPLISQSQKLFGEVLSRRAAEIRAARQAWRPIRTGRLCVVAEQRFRLWDDAGFALAEALARTAPASVELVRVCPDDPASASPLAVARAAAACDALITVNTARHDAPDLLPDQMPWVTWQTTPRVPAARGAGPHDALLVADPAWRGPAVAAGWPADRVAIAGWPGGDAGDGRTRAFCLSSGAPTPSPGTPGEGRGEGRSERPVVPTPSPALPRSTGGGSRVPASEKLAPAGSWEPSAAKAAAIIVDTRPLEPPKQIDEFSSHRLLWNSIREELTADPFAVGDDPAAYLDHCLARFGVAPAGLDRRLFVEELILPCFAQRLAAILLGEGIPLRLFGRGWSDLPEFRAHAAGEIATRDELARALAASAVLVHAWPAPHAHPLDACGRATVHPGCGGKAAFVREVRRALAAGKPAAQRGPQLSFERVLPFIGER